MPPCASLVSGANRPDTWLAFQDDVKQELVDTSEQLITAQAQRDRNAMKLEQIAQRSDGIGDEQAGSQDGSDEPELTVLTGHLNRIAALEKEVKRLKQVQLAYDQGSQGLQSVCEYLWQTGMLGLADICLSHLSVF